MSSQNFTGLLDAISQYDSSKSERRWDLYGLCNLFTELISRHSSIIGGLLPVDGKYGSYVRGLGREIETIVLKYVEI